ncbi:MULTISPECIES: hypothetical protein [Halobacterium]|uniref:hypothetical protein n=1 Tax=Halobacterium TaxID=2239 RepID=UPI00073E9DD5|nr:MULTISPECIES: hypothetical protein [Halobacterium]MCG1004098.1 hypothetical protein [Halobacterium noricense]
MISLPEIVLGIAGLTAVLSAVFLRQIIREVARDTYNFAKGKITDDEEDEVRGGMMEIEW